MERFRIICPTDLRHETGALDAYTYRRTEADESKSEPFDFRCGADASPSKTGAQQRSDLGLFSEGQSVLNVNA
jgi:hypothetical protein